MDTILDMKKVFVSSVCFSLLPTDVAGDHFFILFISGNCIGICFGKMAPVTNYNGGNLFRIQFNG